MILSRKGSAVVTVAASATVAEAVRVMNEYRIGSIVVMAPTGIEGIFTERDVLTRIVADGRDPQSTLVRDVMTREVLKVTPRHTVEEIIEIFTTRRCRHLPVMEAGAMVGLISIGDVSRWMVEKHRAEAEHLRAYIAGDLAT